MDAQLSDETPPPKLGDLTLGQLGITLALALGLAAVAVAVEGVDALAPFAAGFGVMVLLAPPVVDWVNGRRQFSFPTAAAIVATLLVAGAGGPKLASERPLFWGVLGQLPALLLVGFANGQFKRSAQEPNGFERRSASG